MTDKNSLCKAVLILLGTTEIEGGFPHSEIPGSKPVRGSPGLIAAYHVLLRLSAPRHPPDTLKALDRSHYQCPSRHPASAEGDDALQSRTASQGHDRKDQFAQTYPGALRSSDARVTGDSDDRQLPVGRPESLAGPTGYVSSSRCVVTRDIGHKPIPRNCQSGRTKTPRRQSTVWWSQTGSNRRPHACKARALPTELWPRKRD